MPGVLYWVQVAGGVVSLALMAAAILAGAYASVRDAPEFVRRLTGVNRLEAKIDRLLTDHRLAQQLQLQQAEAFNALNSTVCEEHDISEEQRPPGMDTEQIQREILDRDDPDFTRGGD